MSDFLKGLLLFNQSQESHNRLVIPIRFSGPHGRYILELGLGNLLKARLDEDWSLQLLMTSEEFLISASHQLAFITSLLLVSTEKDFLTKSYSWYWKISDMDNVVYFLQKIKQRNLGQNNYNLMKDSIKDYDSGKDTAV